MSIDYQGDLQCNLTHETSGAAITTDAPLDNGGKGTSFSPTDLVGAALGSCMITVMALIAQRKQILFKGVQAEVMKEMVQSPTRRIGKLTVVLHMPSGLSDEERVLLERAAMTCPVHASLHPAVDLSIRFLYPADASA